MACAPRPEWSTRLGFILASIGGAIGLGNVWRFPYVTGKYGGASFLIIFLGALILVALPLLMVEFGIGRNTKRNYTGALKQLLPGTRWYLTGIMGVIAMILILSFYFGISGWTLAYFFKSISGSYASMPPEQLGPAFQEFLNSPAELIFWQSVIVLITGVIVARGVNGGIENAAKFLLPVLFLMIAGLVVRSVTLPGASAGIDFYLKPDWSKVNAEAILAAFGQAFFTLGVGVGNLTIYGSYLNRQRSIASSATIVAGGDTMAALMMGLLIFPAAMAYGINPEVAGPPLVFLTLPSVFLNMDYGLILASIFYLCLFFACLTTTICILEGIVGYLIDEWHWERRKSVIVTCLFISVLGIPQMLSFGPLSSFLIFDRTLFELVDFFVSSIVLPMGGLIMSLLAGWIIKDHLVKEINEGRGIKVGSGFVFCLKFVAPVVIIIILWNQF